MNYLEWNNALGEYYFNYEKAEQEVHLFITKYEVVDIGRKYGLEGDNESIFIDFIKAIKKGIPGIPVNSNILEQALYTFEKWKENPAKIDGVTVKFPLYIGYLSLFVLPLTESKHTNCRVDAYYPRVRSFLKKFELPSMPTQSQNRNWNCLWDDLFMWSFEKKNTELGYLEVHPFKNDRWVYVGKPLSQSIFPLRALRQLPQFFKISGLVPGENINYKIIRRLLLNNGEKHLGLSYKIINIIRNTNNEIGQSIINVVIKNYNEWSGITDQYDSDTETTKKGITIAQLRLCIEGDMARGYKFYYRLFTKLDFPEDLIFTYEDKELKCHQFGKGWSKPILLPFKQGLEIQDSLNKWKAKFPDKNIRLFIEGKNFHLSGWVEVPNIVASRMMLLVKKDQSASIEEWGDCFPNGNFKKIPLKEIPDDHVLYDICNPPIGHPDIPVLQFKSEKSLLITGGLKIGVRTWLNELHPDVELENGRGNETVYIVYENHNDKIFLERKDIDQPVWTFPPNILTNKGFYVKVEGEVVKGEQLRNVFKDSLGKVELLHDKMLPARNKFGQIANNGEIDSYVIGSKLLAENDRKFRLRQALYTREFRPDTTTGQCISHAGSKFIDYNSFLVNFLTVKGISSSKEYFEAFESAYHHTFSPKEIESHTIELSRLKRWSLNYLDYMGILDYEYSTKTIVVNPPQFILIPTSYGRKALLIGGRTPEFIEKITIEAEKAGFYLNLEPQDNSLSAFILPPTVYISGFDEHDGSSIERKLRTIAENCSISFDPNKLPQFRLAEFSGNIEDFKNKLTPDIRFDDSGWPARVFDVDRLRFIPSETNNIDKDFSLVEYRLTEYSFKHRLWMNGYPYDINKNWGRFIILNQHRKEVIFNDREKNIVAIPAALPLPRLISEAMTLFSGKAPKRLYLEIDGIKTWFNVYANIPPVFASNYFKKVGQIKRELTINL